MRSFFSSDAKQQPKQSDDVIYDVLYTLWKNFYNEIVHTKLLKSRSFLGNDNATFELEIDLGVDVIEFSDSKDSQNNRTVSEKYSLILNELKSCFHQVEAPINSSQSTQSFKITRSQEAKKAFDIIQRIKLNLLTDLFLSISRRVLSL